MQYCSDTIVPCRGGEVKVFSLFCPTNCSRLSAPSAVLCVAKEVGKIENLITELYYGNICPVEQMGKLAPETKAVLKRMHENEDKLKATLNDQEKALLHAIQDDELEVEAVSPPCGRLRCHKT